MVKDYIGPLPFSRLFRDFAVLLSRARVAKASDAAEDQEHVEDEVDRKTGCWEVHCACRFLSASCMVLPLASASSLDSSSAIL